MLVFWVFCKRFDNSGINILWQFLSSIKFSSFPGEKLWLPEYSEYSSSAVLNRIRFFHLGGKGGIWIRETGLLAGWGGNRVLLFLAPPEARIRHPTALLKKGGEGGARDSWQIVLGVVSFPAYFYTTFENVFDSFCFAWIEMSLLKKIKQQWSPRILIIASQSCPWFPGKSIISRCWHGKLMWGVSDREKGELIANRSRDQTRSFLEKD